MDLNKFAQEVHENAVAHGWWGEEYTTAVVYALIQSEIAEAFEEWRAGRPMLWHECGGNFKGMKIVCEKRRCPQDYDGKPKEDCVLRQEKPEGIAAELGDVALRILDAAAAWNMKIIQGDIGESVKFGREAQVNALDLPQLVTGLHYIVAMAHASKSVTECTSRLNTALCMIFAWLDANDVDPETILREKHEYNRGRPYKHGGKRV